MNTLSFSDWDDEPGEAPDEEPHFTPISASRDVLGAMQFALKSRHPVVITSPAGMGKTTALRHYGKELGAKYVEVTLDSRRWGGLLRAIYKAITGRATDHRENRDIYASLESILSRGGAGRPLLVVDEFQNIELESLLDLVKWPKRFNISLVLSGNYHRLVRRKSREVDLAQITTRILQNVELKSPTKADCEALGTEFNVEIRDGQRALAAYGREKSVREIVGLLESAEIATGGQGMIRVDHLVMALRGIGAGERDIKQLLGIETSGQRRLAR